MDHEALNPLALYQVLTPPFRAETGIQPQLIPIYSAELPVIPPYSPYRSIQRMPKFPPVGQIARVITLNNIVMEINDETVINS